MKLKDKELITEENPDHRSSLIQINIAILISFKKKFTARKMIGWRTRNTQKDDCVKYRLAVIALRGKNWSKHRCNTDPNRFDA